MHLLGLNWQLQPADGHTFNNGMRTGLPGTDDVATLPSGGKGEVTAAARPLEVAGTLRAAASWFKLSNPNLGRCAKRERKKGGGGASPFRGAPVRSCLLFLSVSCCVWPRSPGWPGARPQQCAYLCYLRPWRGPRPLESIGGWAELQQPRSWRKSFPGENAGAQRALSWGEAASPGGSPARRSLKQKDSGSEQLGFGGE